MCAEVYTRLYKLFGKQRKLFIKISDRFDRKMKVTINCTMFYVKEKIIQPVRSSEYDNVILVGHFSNVNVFIRPLAK